MTDSEGDGVALYSTPHPPEITEEMISAGIHADGGLPAGWSGGTSEDQITRLRAIYTAMYHAAPPWPEDISEDALVEAEVEIRMPDWQPIETAPRGRPLFKEDGPRILLGWEHRPDVIAIGSFRSNAEFTTPIWRDGYGGGLVEPTHWMPLPEGPTPMLPSILNK